MHEVQVEMEVVGRDQTKTEDFFRFDQVADVSARKAPASGTGTLFFNRALVETIGVVFQVDGADFGEGCAVPRESSWEYAVKHVYSAGDHFLHNLRGGSRGPSHIAAAPAAGTVR